MLLSLTSAAGFVPEALLQALLAAMILSMLATPFLIAASDRIVMRLSRSEWMLRSLEVHRIAVQSIEAERHVILGYGRNGQRIARLLDAEGVRYIALDLDPERVREAAAAGDTVVFADSARREALVAAGISRAAAVVVTFADPAAAMRVLAHMSSIRRWRWWCARATSRTSSGSPPRALPRGAGARGAVPPAALGFDRLGVQVRAVRRPGTKSKLAPAEAGLLQAGDVVVLLGAPDLVGAAETACSGARQEKAGPQAGSYKPLA